MTMIIEDACFTADAKIRIIRVAGNVTFRRCSFEGCEIFVAAEVEEPVFTQCLFRGASFTGQPLSPRIARDCQCCCADIEMTKTSSLLAERVRFRR
jgi:hypothetical protein